VNQWVDLAERTFTFACSARFRFAKGDSQTKKEILATIGSNLMLKNKLLNIEAKKPFLILEESLSDEQREDEPIEPETPKHSQRPNKAHAIHNPRLRRGRDDVRTYSLKHKRLIKSVYTFFRRYRGSPCNIFPGWEQDENIIKKRGQKHRRWTLPEETRKRASVSQRS